MRYTIRIDLPDAQTVRADLVPRVPARFADAIRDCERDVAARHAELREATIAIEPMRERVARGAAPASALEQALHRRDAAALQVGPAEQALSEAQQALASARQAAEEETIERAVRWRDRVQATVDEIKPALEAARTIEELLDGIVRPLGLPAGVPALEWPMTLDDEGLAINRGRALR